MIDLAGAIRTLLRGWRHSTSYIGHIWYVDGDIAVSGNGYEPHKAFKTITEGFAAMCAGDRLQVKAGVYDENGLDMDLDGMELICEVGVVIKNTNPGTCLTVSGNTCLVNGLVVNQAGQIGFYVTGGGAFLTDCVASECGVGFDLNGPGSRCSLVRCKDQNCTVTGYDIATQENTLYLCNSIASGGASREYYLSNTAAHRNMLYQCLSLGNGTAGFETVDGADSNAFAWCVSGANDGAPVDDGFNNIWDIQSNDRIDEHESTSPNPDGEGTAGDPIVVQSEINDETGADSTMNYYGDVAAMIYPAVITAEWYFKGVNLFAVTGLDDQRFHCYRIVYKRSATRNGGNAWDEGATVLTVQDATEAALFEVNDMVWIMSPGYHPNGELVKVTDVTGAVITIARNVENSARTGLHWNYTTNDPGNEVMYLAERASVKQYNETKFDYSAPSAKDFSSQRWNIPRRMSANDGVVVRMMNGTDAANSQCGLTTIWSN